jgi:hypothetical protein
LLLANGGISRAPRMRVRISITLLDYDTERIIPEHCSLTLGEACNPDLYKGRT